MRIRRLELERFGHFTDRAFDFGLPGDRPDFHIVYGRNEAGKTTTMEAVLRLFYGFAAREDYAFRHMRANLQVSAELEIGGTARRFTRLPRRSGSLVDAGGTVLPETALSACLAGLSEADYRRLLCLDDETIEQGGEEIANARGDIGRLLFSAAAGVADLSGVLDGVRAEAEAIWKKRGRTTRIAELKRDLAELEREIRDRDVTASAWKALKRDRARAQAAETEARRDRDRLAGMLAGIAARRRALPLMAELTRLEAALAPFADWPHRLDFDPERLVALRTEHGTATQRRDQLEREIAELAAGRAAPGRDPAAPDPAAALEELRDLAARDRGAELDLDRRRAELRAAEAAMRHAIGELGLPAGTDPGALVCSPAEIAALEAAREALRDTAA
ncbi:ATP-binding protein, partial [Mangrovicoccus algicola]